MLVIDKLNSSLPKLMLIIDKFNVSSPSLMVALPKTLIETEQINEVE